MAERAVGLSVAVRQARPADPRDPREGIGAEALYAHLKRFFERCARKLRRSDDVQGAERFAKASTPWLRHTHASHAIATGMPLEIAHAAAARGAEALCHRGPALTADVKCARGRSARSRCENVRFLTSVGDRLSGFDLLFRFSFTAGQLPGRKPSGGRAGLRFNQGGGWSR
ncbi:hypothetical protein HLB44_35295 [Aquincola sp. S2]|uniref:Uncharacterized protein n=1 Tax=Pseudaquabacterium terrae TaxID=2732868 RepID=A0ABX2EV13_9BURK|nr:hypothetical protein [Aquabacterium terrae]